MKKEELKNIFEKIQLNLGYTLPQKLIEIYLKGN